MARGWRALCAVLPAFAGTALMAPVPGAAANSVTLPNGRTITPAGSVVTATDFPAALALAPAGLLFTAGAGEATSQLGAVSATSLQGTYRETTSGSGGAEAEAGSLAISHDGNTLFASGAGDGDVMSFTAADPPQEGTRYSLPDGRYAGGISADPTGLWLFVTEPFDVDSKPFQRGNRLTRFSLADGSAKTTTVGTLPDHVASAKLASGVVVAAVANLGDGTVTAVRADDLSAVASVQVGRHPSDLAFTSDGRHLIVVSSLDDRIDDIATDTWKVDATLSVSSPAGIGASPDGLAISADGSRVYVALIQDNAIALISRSPDGAMSLAGRIPTAWWPTAVALDEANHVLLVAAGKGENLGANTPPDLDAGSAPEQNPGPIGVFNPQGTLERIPLDGGEDQLATWSAQVAVNNGWTAPAPYSALCGPTQVTHVVWIVRENKTYDEEFGDLSGGDPQFTIYGRNITPNTHALAERFGLLTAFYDDEEVSDIGHPALAGSIVSDFLERMVLQNYGGKEPVEYSNYGSDASAQGYNNDSVQWGPSDYLIDDALAQGLRFLDFGHAYRNNPANQKVALTAQEEAGIVRDFPGYGFNLGVRDQDRAAFWSKRWNKDVAAGTVPPLEIVYLPDDHTGNGAPPQQVADNDLGTGQIVQTVSQSALWGSTAVFVEEDDPQSGVDHVDEHRSIGLMISPWTKPGLISAVHHDQTSMLRTIELLLGLPPLTEVDGTATPFTEMWSTTPDLRPFTVQQPSVPALSAAATRAALAYQAQRYGPHPDFNRLGAQTQLDVQWMWAKGTPFDPAMSPRHIGAAAAGEQLNQVGPAPAGVCATASIPGKAGAAGAGVTSGLTNTSRPWPLPAIAFGVLLSAIAMVLVGLRARQVTGRP